ncbi:MAG: hypothetical protein ISP90_16870 [Nevskia sp.]|nr:hypothetical protein [Nevskia sp.]
MNPGLPALPRPASMLPLVCAVLLAGCTYVRDTFSQTVDNQVQDKVHAAVPIGTPMDTAEARLASMDFSCQVRQGNFTDEHGHQQSAPRFLACTRRAGMVSFACENRDQVVVVPNNGVVDEVEVLRGPDCDRPPHVGGGSSGGVSNIPK